MTEIVERHRRACNGFSQVAAQITGAQWEQPTPCAEWDAAALVEHLIGFHELLVLRPLGLRTLRPKTGPAARWAATAGTLFAALDAPGTLDRSTELPGGGQSSPRTMRGALTTDVLVHTWDLAARATGVDPALDPELCAGAYDGARSADIPRDSGMFGPEVTVPPDADVTTRLIALFGRDPDWTGEAR